MSKHILRRWVAVIAGFAMAHGMLPAMTAEAAPRATPTRAVSSAQVTAITGSIVTVGAQRYQIAGMRAPRVNRAQCFYEKRLGRRSQRALQRLLARKPIEVTPTGGSNAFGLPLVNIKARGIDVRQRMIAMGYAQPRMASGRPRNPWCVQP